MVRCAMQIVLKIPDGVNKCNSPERVIGVCFLWVRRCCATTLLAVIVSVAILAGHPSALHAAACAPCVTDEPGLLLRWRRVDVGVDVRSAEVDAALNRYDAGRIAVRLQMRAPSGRRLNVAAFPAPGESVAGRASFLVRWTPDEAGVWRVMPQLRLAGGAWRSGPSRSWRVADAAGRGFVRVDPMNPAMLRFDDGESFFPIGANIAWYTNDAIEEYRRRFDALAAAGGTATRVWLAPWSFLPEWKDTPLRNYANRELRMEWFDQVLRMAEERGIYLIVALSESGMFDPGARWGDNPYNAANGGPCAAPHDFLTNPDARAAYANQLRYIVARWGYSPNILAWEWMNEVNSAPGFETERLLPWLREMSAVLDEYDVHRHLRTISYASIAGDPRVWALPEIEIVQRHEYAQGDPAWFRPLPVGQERFRQVREQPNKPLLVGEFGANSDMEHARGAYRQGIHLHNGLWASAFAGMAGAAMYWWWDNYLEPGRLWWRHAGLAEFLRGEDLGRMTPAAMHVRAGAGPPVVALRLRATAAQRACAGAHALVWVRNSAWQHDAALLRWVLDHSAGLAQPETFRYTATPSRDVELRIDDVPRGRYVIEAHDTETGRLRRSIEVRSDGALRWSEPQIAADLAYKIYPAGCAARRR